ncbi:MAG: hypothetical protein QNJ63_09985 [Calothrix sp. MO_192.B10]|nr:hypothetical protein [Calothrix sp. MO_192.B10]
MFKRGNQASPSLLSFLVLVVVLGCLTLAVIDDGYRSDFARLAEILVSGYIGSLMPRLPS